MRKVKTIHSSNRYSLRTYYLPSPGPATGDQVNIRHIPCSQEDPMAGIISPSPGSVQDLKPTLWKLDQYWRRRRQEQEPSEKRRMTSSSECSLPMWILKLQGPTLLIVCFVSFGNLSEPPQGWLQGKWISVKVRQCKHQNEELPFHLHCQMYAGQRICKE